METRTIMAATGGTGVTEEMEETMGMEEITEMETTKIRKMTNATCYAYIRPARAIHS
jgi:hypothetical protein